MRTPHWIRLSAAAAALTLTAGQIAGCRTDRPRKSAARDDATGLGPAATASASAPPAAHDADEKNCGCEPPSPPTADSVTKSTDPATGRPVVTLGQPLGEAPVVTVKELTEAPDRYVGKRVAIEGAVFSMCVHRRAWFAIRGPGETSGPYLRIVTAPAFRVPQGSIGKHARAEGSIEFVDIPARQAAHYASQHGLGDGAAAGGPTRSVILRATGAEFM